MFFPSLRVLPNPKEQRPEENVKRSKMKKLGQKVANFFKGAAIFILGVALFATNPNIFAIGLVIGVIFDKQVQHAANRIVKIWKKQPWKMIALIAVASFFALPVAWGSVSLLYAAERGCSLSLKTRARQEFVRV